MFSNCICLWGMGKTESYTVLGTWEPWPELCKGRKACWLVTPFLWGPRWGPMPDHVCEHNRLFHGQVPAHSRTVASGGIVQH